MRIEFPRVLAIGLLAQSDTATVHGTVFDQSKAIVPECESHIDQR
jgi:hypothetical protein